MKIIFTVFLIFISLFVFNTTAAEETSPCRCDDGRFFPGIFSAEDCTKMCNATPSSNAPVNLPNPLGDGPEKTDIPVLLGKIIKSVLGIIGSLALVMFIYGGATWMLSGGNQEQVTKGKNILIWATVGIAIIFTAYALVKFVLTTVTNP